MSSEVKLKINTQKKIMRALKGAIIALIAFIGILKISIGGVINVPIALLFGDIFIAFFALLLILAFYLVLFPLPKRKRRNILVFFSLIGLLIITSAFYAAKLRDFNVDASQFSAELEAMILLARANFSFTAAKDVYWYTFGGIFGEGIILLLTPLTKGGIIALLTIVTIFLYVVIFWPLLVKLAKIIKEYVRDLKKRRSVLQAAGVINHEKDNNVPTQVKLDEVMEKEVITPSNPLLHRVGQQKIKQAPKIEIEIETPAEEREHVVLQEDPFVLPSLDAEEKIEAIQTTNAFNQSLQKVAEESFESLQKAVDTSGSFETVQFNHDSEPKSSDEGDLNEEAAPMPPLETNANKDADPVTFNENNDTKTVLKVSYANFKLPPINLLDDAVDSGKSEQNRLAAADYEQRINAFFNDFNIGARVTAWTIGSTFTRFEIQLEARESLKSITPHMNDISLRLNGAAVRFEPIIPGKATSGLEVANTHRTIVNFKECMQTIIKTKKNEKYVIPIGKDVAGNVISAPFSEFPHLLVAGSTGSGKSVFIHTVLTSLIMMHSPNELRLLLIDPKRVELAQYANIPHLLTPIVKEPSESKIALLRLIDEMENRYRLFEAAGVSKVSDYNELAADNGKEELPIIVTIVDEFADLFESEKEVSSLVLRLVQKSRAAGIHLLIATQRPSVQVITGNIKANIPSRVAFMTASVVDSMTILGQGGAETLLGYGDMLVESLAMQHRGFLRVQAPFIPIKEVNRITNYLRTNYMTSFYEEFLDLKEKVVMPANNNGQNDDLYPLVLEYVLTQETISISRIQQQFNAGFLRSRQLYDALMFNGIIEPPDDANSSKGAVVVANRR